jgi:hypothetical protein
MVADLLCLVKLGPAATFRQDLSLIPSFAWRLQPNLGHDDYADPAR